MVLVMRMRYQTQTVRGGSAIYQNSRELADLTVIPVHRVGLEVGGSTRFPTLYSHTTLNGAKLIRLRVVRHYIQRRYVSYISALPLVVNLLPLEEVTALDWSELLVKLIIVCHRLHI